MKEKIPYETPSFCVVRLTVEDIITSSFSVMDSIVDNDGDYRDWETDGAGW